MIIYSAVQKSRATIRFTLLVKVMMTTHKDFSVSASVYHLEEIQCLNSIKNNCKFRKNKHTIGIIWIM